MKKINKNIMMHIITAICLLLAGAFLYYIITVVADFGFDDVTGQGTKFDFVSDSSIAEGFNHEKIIYTENGMTSVRFSGEITVSGTAEISIVSDDGRVVYNKTYSDVKSKSIKMKVTDLTPYSYYTLRFSSNKAKVGSLALISNQALTKYPERPEKPVSIPNK